ncbi:hypothetical protein EB796_024408 [Bugula neritina]|uniref:Uncharacterized protein n=1 Tax=Bugula neritina TaxID=10212 RepID=A0A7J7ITN5_BUGNE|nr:hypothetical protein EB796_024408 [Bugula neritina]
MSDEELQLIKALDEETMEGEGSEEEEESENETEEANADEDDVDMSDAEHLEDVIGKQKHEPSKSQYETRKEKLAARIKAMEDKALSDQPWQLKGGGDRKVTP